MKNNENGFTYPLTLSILIIFLLIFSVRIEQLQSERKMAIEIRKILVQEYYMATSVKKLEKILQEGGLLESNGTFHYKFGEMEYKPITPVNDIQKVSFTLHLDTGEIANGVGDYDLNFKKMVNWVEKN
jgi:hypothetical protein